MTTEWTERLVLTDQDGNYYLFSREMLDAARVPAEHAAELRAEVDKLSKESDVSGYSLLLTSQAVGEEGGSARPAPELTTLAIGEEGGTHLDPIRLPFEPPWFQGLPR
jgi:hypothetical protein